MAYKFQLGAFTASGSITAESGFDAADQDITNVGDVSLDSLTADGGSIITINNTARVDADNRMEFRDSDLYIQSDADGQLKMRADSDLVMTIGSTDVIGVDSSGAAITGTLVVSTSISASSFVSASAISLDDASGLAGRALSDDSGALRVDANGTSFQFGSGGTGEIQLNSSVAGDALALASHVLNVQVDDSSIEVSSDALQVKALGVTNAMLAGSIENAKLSNSTISGVSLGDNLASLSKATNGGVNFTSYNGSAAVSDLQLDLSDLAAAAIDVAADSIAIYDADADVTGLESVADLMTATAGDALAATSGVLDVQVDDSSIEVASDALRVKALGVTNAMLAGSITANKMNNAIFEDLETLGAASSDGQFIVATGAGAFQYESGDTARTSLGLGTSDSPSFAGLTVNGDLTVTGSLTYVNTTNLAITDALITVGSGSSAFAADYGLEFGAMDGGWASIKTGTYDIDGDSSAENCFIFSHDIRAAEINADSFYGSFIGSIEETVQTVTSTGTINLNSGMQVIANSSGGAITLTLPTPGALEGKILKIKRLGSANDVTISANGSENIDGQAGDIVLESEYGAVNIISDGSNYFIV